MMRGGGQEEEVNRQGEGHAKGEEVRKKKSIGREKGMLRGGGQEEEVNRQGEGHAEGRRSGRRSQ